ALGEIPVEARLHAAEREHRPAEGVADERLLLAGLDERRHRPLGVVAVLLLRLLVDAIELERVLVDAVALERLIENRRAVRTPGNLHLEREPEGADALLPRRAAEGAQCRRGADRARLREMLARRLLADPEAVAQQLEIEIAMIGLAQVPELAHQVAG